MQEQEQEQQDVLADICDVMKALIKQELSGLVHRLDTLELEAELTKAAKPRHRVPAGSKEVAS